ncbi:AMIN-like domain-containing (lipo)protein [Actinophytocola sp.]|uniref:AMIN-like domain-containing (lipo)protein n=1 Tax=Actinophytocola sp. TaxID=1872138 RepID=UPI002ED89EBE
MRRITMAMVAGIAASTMLTACDGAAEQSGSQATTTARTAPPTARGAPTTGRPAETPIETAEGVKAQQPSACGETQHWNTAGETAAPYSTAALYLVRAGQHDCYDRVVFDVNGPTDVGYAVRYVPVVTVDGSGTPMPVPGKAALEVVLRAAVQGYDDSGHQPGKVLADTGDYLCSPTGWRSLRAVRFAGFFEGQSTLAVGVREKLPFRVTTQLDRANQVRRVILDIAH